jgi:hypothetical protein
VPLFSSAVVRCPLFSEEGKHFPHWNVRMQPCATKTQACTHAHACRLDMDDNAVAGQDWTFLQGAVQMVQGAESLSTRLQVRVFVCVYMHVCVCAHSQEQEGRCIDLVGLVMQGNFARDSSCVHLQIIHSETVIQARSDPADLDPKTSIPV